MPYSSGDTLPSNVQKLSKELQARWVSVFNSSFARASKDKEAVAFRNANAAVKNASTNYASMYSRGGLGRAVSVLKADEPPATIQVFPAPGHYDHPVWGGFDITREGNQKFIDQFDAQVYQDHIPIDAEHETKLSGAVGYYKSLTMQPDGSVDAGIDWTDRGEKLIRGGGFKYFSPEWFDEWEDPANEGHTHENVLVGGAIVRKPYFKDLRPLAASEGDLFDIDEDGEGELVERTDDLRSTILTSVQSEFPDTITSEATVVDFQEGHVIVGVGDLYYRLEYEVTDEGTHFARPTEAAWSAADHEDDEDEKGANGKKKKKFPFGKSKGDKMSDKTALELLEGMSDDDRKTALEAIGKKFHEEEEEDKSEDDTRSEDKKEEDEDDSKEAKSASEKRLESELKAAREQVKKTETRVGVLEATNQTRHFRDIIMGRDESGVKAAHEAEAPIHPMIGELEDKAKILVKLSSEGGEDSDEFKAYVASEREHANSIHASDTFREVGTGSVEGGIVSSSAVKEFEGLVDKDVEANKANDKHTRADSVRKIASENSKLYNEYDKKKTGRTHNWASAS